MDLLDDYLRQARDSGKTYRGNARQNVERHAPPMLLGRLYAPQKNQRIGIQNQEKYIDNR
jgi:hypothetical protein